MRPVAGISVGLVTEFDEAGTTMKRYTMLSTSSAPKTHYGDMDFKLCGTDEGVTGYQLDLKLPGISAHHPRRSRSTRPRTGRTKILDVMNSVLAGPAAELSPHAPRIETVKINPEKIGELIGPGGKNIKGIQAESGAEINIEDDGTVHIYASKQEGSMRAQGDDRPACSRKSKSARSTPARLSASNEFGAFMEVLPGKDGLIHVSELADFRVDRVEDVVKVGDFIPAKCIGVDDKGRVKMSRRAAMKERDAEEQGSGGDGASGAGADGGEGGRPRGGDGAGRGGEEPRRPGAGAEPRFADQ